MTGKRILQGLAVSFFFLGHSAASAQNAPAVVVAPAEVRDLRETVKFTGRVVSLQKIDLRARVSGFLESVNFTEGEPVEDGSVLYEIEDETYQAAVEEIAGTIGSAEAELHLAKIELGRKETLVKRKTVAQSALDEAQAAYNQTASQIAGLKASKTRAELELSYTKIIAPFSGVVGLSNVDVGALVGPDSGPLVTLTRLDPISVEFPVATSALLDYQERVRKGEISGKADIEIIQPNGSVYPSKGNVNYISSNVNQSTDTVIVRAMFENPDSILLDGSLVGVALAQASPQKVLAIPQQAVQRDQAGSFVMVVDAESKAEKRRVEVARNESGFAVISKGLKEGELVVTEGLTKVRPGIVVDAAQTPEG